MKTLLPVLSDDNQSEYNHHSPSPPQNHHLSHPSPSCWFIREIINKSLSVGSKAVWPGAVIKRLTQKLGKVR